MKILERYKIPGYKCRVTTFVISRSNTLEESVQLSSDLGFIDIKALERKPASKRQSVRHNASEDDIQLTFDLHF